MPVYYSQKFKITSLFLLVFLLTSCNFFEEKNTEQPATPFIKVPTNWDLTARASVQYQNEFKSFSLHWQQQNQDYKIILSGGFLSLFSIIIEKKNQQTFIDDKPLNTSLKSWMLQNYGWFLPINEMKQWIFTQKNHNNDWQVKILKQHPFQFKNEQFKIASQKLKLTHKQNNIKIKLIIKNIKEKIRD